MGWGRVAVKVSGSVLERGLGWQAKINAGSIAARHQSLVWCVGVCPGVDRSADRSRGTASSGSSTRCVAQLLIFTAALQQVVGGGRRGWVGAGMGNTQ